MFEVIRSKKSRWWSRAAPRAIAACSIPNCVLTGILLTQIPLQVRPAFAQTPRPPSAEDTAPFWQVAYWNNQTLSGEPVVTDTDGELDHNWGSAAPHGGVNADRYSARWRRHIDEPAGTYRFTATSDDGMRIYIDDDLVIDRWYDHPPQTFTADVSLREGHHLVTVDYYENTGGAVAKVSWRPVPAPTDTWRAQYFDNPWLSGTPRLTLRDARIDFNWGYGSPAREIPDDGFSVRWTRTVRLEPDAYRFTVASDDGVRLWVNEHLLIDNWRDQALTHRSGTIYLAGDAEVRMEYYESGGVATARLMWEQAGQDPTPGATGAVTVDDTDPGFIKGGSWTGWRTAAEGYGDRLTWTKNNDRRRANYNWARWCPDLEPGRYEVFVYIPERYTTSAQARYWVSHRDGHSIHLVDQSANGSQWVSLGTYWFSGTHARDGVSLSDVTYEPYVTRLIAFDAVKWVPQ